MAGVESAVNLDISCRNVIVFGPLQCALSGTAVSEGELIASSSPVRTNSAALRYSTREVQPSTGGEVTKTEMN